MVLFYLALLLSIGNVWWMLKVSLSDRTSFGSLERPTRIAGLKRHGGLRRVGALRPHIPAGYLTKVI
jgi:hypothetical protein